MLTTILLQAASVATDVATTVAAQATQVVVEKSNLDWQDALLNSIFGQGPYAVLLSAIIYFLWKQYQKQDNRLVELQKSKDDLASAKDAENGKLRTDLAVSEHKIAGMTQQAVNSFQTVGWALQDIRLDIENASNESEKNIKDLESLVRESTNKVLQISSGK